MYFHAFIAEVDRQRVRLPLLRRDFSYSLWISISFMRLFHFRLHWSMGSNATNIYAPTPQKICQVYNILLYIIIFKHKRIKHEENYYNSTF